MSWNCKDDQKAAAKWPLLTGRCSSYSAAHLTSGALWAVVVAACSVCVCVCVCVCVICLREKQGFLFCVWFSCLWSLHFLVGRDQLNPSSWCTFHSVTVNQMHDFCFVFLSFFFFFFNHFISLSDNRWCKLSLPPMSAKSAATIKAVIKLFLHGVRTRERERSCGF